MRFDVIEPQYSGSWATLKVDYRPVVFDMHPGNLSQSTEAVTWPQTAVSANLAQLRMEAQQPVVSNGFVATCS